MLPWDAVLPPRGKMDTFGVTLTKLKRLCQAAIARIRQ